MKLTRIAVTAALATVVAAPSAAVAFEDDDTFPGDPASPVVVYEADGDVVESGTKAGMGAFVASLVAQRAQGGSYSVTTTNGAISDYSRVGVAHPSVRRYARLQRPKGGQAEAVRTISRASTVVGGSVVTESGYAVDLASGRVRRISLDAARRLSADPREGAANTEYVYFRNVKPVGAGQ